MSSGHAPIDAFLFDLGGVLIDWDPRYLYRKLFNGDDAAMEHFLTHVCSHTWSEKQDAGRSFPEAAAELAAQNPDKAPLIHAWLAGRSFAEAAAELTAQNPDKAPLIHAWLERFDEMMAGPIDGTVKVLKELRAKRTPLYALSNWPTETFPVAQRRFDFLGWFDGTVVSGVEKVTKPNPRLFRILMERHDIAPENAVFIDDREVNTEAARKLGFHAIHFTTPPALRQKLQTLGML